MVLKDGYPCLEPLVNLPEPTRKLLTAYETVSEANDHDGVQRSKCVRQKTVQQSLFPLINCLFRQLFFVRVKGHVYWMSKYIYGHPKNIFN